MRGGLVSGGLIIGHVQVVGLVARRAYKCARGSYKQQFIVCKVKKTNFTIPICYCCVLAHKNP